MKTVETLDSLITEFPKRQKGQRSFRKLSDSTHLPATQGTHREGAEVHRGEGPPSREGGAQAKVEEGGKQSLGPGETPLPGWLVGMWMIKNKIAFQTYPFRRTVNIFS